MPSPDKEKLVLKSSFEEIERVEPFVKKLQKKSSFDDDDFSRILLVLTEAVNNAIIHGNRQNPNKKVFVDASLSDEVLKITIRDEGEGFDPDSLADPLKEENLLKEGGRGVYLIKHYTDDHQFSKNGTELMISFSLDK
ncbi:MAG TPA: ATP-binding protein [Balneolaceae bacterium]|nr:ATP-binding protein [Balneolaceae bacterium]